MPPRQTEEERADFLKALHSIAEEEPLSAPELDALSVLEGDDLGAFDEVWQRLPAPRKIRLLTSLRGAAEQRLRLDFNAIDLLALGDADAHVRRAGIECSLEDKSTARLAKLIELAQLDADPNVRLSAVEDLARFALLGELEDLHVDLTRRLRTALLVIVHDTREQAYIRGAALGALGYFSDVDVAEELAAGFADADLRLGAVRGMGRTADPRWTDRLMPVLGSEDPQMRLEAAKALGEIEDERAVAPLVEVLEDPEPEVQMAVIEALGHIGGDEAREALLYVAEAGEEAVAAAAERALGELDEVEADPLDL